MSIDSESVKFEGDNKNNKKNTYQILIEFFPIKIRQMRLSVLNDFTLYEGAVEPNIKRDSWLGSEEK